MHIDSQILWLLQLSSTSLPVGAYSYSEGLETLVEHGKITCSGSLQQWLESELRFGAIRMESAVMVRAYKALEVGDLEALAYWDQWLSAARETEELRNSSQQMGRALIRLLVEIDPQIQAIVEQIGGSGNASCNYAIAFTIAAAFFGISLQMTLLGYLHSWSANLVTTGIKLIPLGQTIGQIIIKDLQDLISQTVQTAMTIPDDNLGCCSWGLALASMQHETLYTRLFRS
jgi:urease accessory protein